MMSFEATSDTLYSVNPRVLGSIKSSDSLIIRGIGASFELPLSIFQVLMAFADKRTVSQAFQVLNEELDMEDLSSIVRDLVERGLLRVEQSINDEDNLHRLLNPGLFSEPSTVATLRRLIRLERAIIIPDALPVEFAAEVHHDLQRSHHWSTSEGGHDFFHYRNSVIANLEDLTPGLAKCSRLFGSRATRRFIGELSGVDCAGEPGVAAAWYRPSDYALPHDDSSLNHSRSVAYIWYLTKDWRREWGGALFWCPTGQYVVPQFNMLIMFKVAPSNLHWVCPVSPSATSKRLTINGFWNRAERGSPLISDSEESFISPRAYGSPAPEEEVLGPIVVL